MTQELFSTIAGQFITLFFLHSNNLILPLNDDTACKFWGEKEKIFFYDRSVIYFCVVILSLMAKGEETRQFIIERSAPIFNTKGIAATSMSDIMEATKLSKGSLYVHFDNKEVLAGVVVEYNMEMLAKKMMQALSPHQHPKDKLFAYIDVFMDPLHPPVTGGCPLMNFGIEADDTNEAVKAKINEGVDYSHQLIVDIIKSGIKTGVFKPEWNYKEFAIMMFAMLEGGSVMGRIAGNNSRLKVIARHLKNMITEQLV